MMSSLVSSYVDAINHGGVPDIKKGWGYVVEESLKRACEIACRCGGRCGRPFRRGRFGWDSPMQRLFLSRDIEAQRPRPARSARP
jgi:hypothetical protein